MAVQTSTEAPKATNATLPPNVLSPTEIENIQKKIAEYVKDKVIFFGGDCAKEFDFLLPSHEYRFECKGQTYSCLWGAMEAQKFNGQSSIQKQLEGVTSRGDAELVTKSNLSLARNISEEAMMEFVARAKFSNNVDLRKFLLSTEDAYLVMHSYSDKAGWGDNMDCRGANKYGSILMQVRGQLGGKGEPRKPDNLYSMMKKQLGY